MTCFSVDTNEPLWHLPRQRGFSLVKRGPIHQQNGRQHLCQIAVFKRVAKGSVVVCCYCFCNSLFALLINVSRHGLGARLGACPRNYELQSYLNDQTGWRMKLIRFIVGRIILLLHFLTRPSPVIRSHEDQDRVDAAVTGLSLYQFKACPFCVKVRRHFFLPLKGFRSSWSR